LILDVVTVKPSAIKTKTKAISAFLGAVEKGTSLLKSNPDEAIPLAAKWLEVSATDVKGMLAGVKLYGVADNAKLFHDAAAAQTLDNISAFYRSHNVIKTTINGSDMIDQSFMPATVAAK
jgi:NitT/TauT family transport system substrate-binding protein